MVIIVIKGCCSYRQAVILVSRVKTMQRHQGSIEVVDGPVDVMIGG